MTRERERAEHDHALALIASLTPITTRPIMPESAETYRNCTADEWEKRMKLKYPEEQGK
jgi:hypothetical protein